MRGFTKEVNLEGSHDENIDLIRGRAQYGFLEKSNDGKQRLIVVFTIGFGGNHRLNSETLKISKEAKQASTYGYRFYTEHKLFSSFYARAEYENLHVTQPHQLTSEVRQTWNSSLLAGIEKRIRISNKVQG